VHIASAGVINFYGLQVVFVRAAIYLQGNDPGIMAIDKQRDFFIYCFHFYRSITSDFAISGMPVYASLAAFRSIRPDMRKKYCICFSERIPGNRLHVPVSAYLS
jgi:hypothetical protein